MRASLVFWRLVAGAMMALLISGCVATADRKAESSLPERRFEFSRAEMAMPFRIVLYATNDVAASNAAHAAFARIGELNLVFSDYEDNSELTRLSKTAGQGKAVKLSDDLWRVLSRAEDLSRRSDGAFDVTIGPVVQLWRRARRQRELPAPDRLAEARAAVGWRKLKLDPKTRTAELLAPGMRLDLGGIAKGYALDAALAVLRTNGIRRALVMGGGDMALGDPPPDRKGWRIELSRLNLTNAPPEEFVLLANAGLATSGDLFQRVIIDGVRYSHIVDPRTGIGLTDHSQVTVIAPDATTADALATTVSVLGPEKGLALVEATRGAAARILRQPASEVEVYRSRRFERFLDRTGGREQGLSTGETKP